MNETDAMAFAQMMAGLGEVFGEQVTPARTEIYFRVLARYSVADVEQMVMSAIERCKFFPKPADLIDQLPDNKFGHLDPEEAWALVAGLSEDDSVVWTDEIATAYGVAQGVLPDRVGARMAFLESYRRQLTEAKRTGHRARWWASLGWQVSGRAAALEDAIDRGRLQPMEARAMLPPHYWRPEWMARQLPPGSTPTAVTE